MSQVFFHRFGRVQRFFFRLLPSLTFFKGHPCRWLLFQVAPVADFFSQVAPVADFYFRLRTSLTFSQVVHVVDFFLSLRTLLIFYRVPHVAFFRSHESFAVFFFRLRLSLTFITGDARRWVFSELRPSLTSFSGCAHCWNFLRLGPSLIFCPKFSMSLKFLPGTRAHKSVVVFYFSLRTSLNFSQFAPLADFAPGYACRRFFFTDSDESNASFSGCFRRWHFSKVTPVADFCFRLRTPLTFTQVAPVADFSPDYAYRCFFFRVARVRRWLPSQVAHIADFFPRSRPLLIFPRLRTSLISFSWSHDSVADFLFGLCLSMTSFSQVAPVTFFFHVALVFVIFFPSSAYRWIFAS